MAGIFEIVAGLFKPAADIIDNLHTSQEEKAQAQVALLEAQSGILARVLDYEASITAQQAKVVVAEAQGQSWLQRNWRPMLMCTFGFIVLWNFVVAPLISAATGSAVIMLELPPGMWTLLQIGVGGYIVGRSGEKISQTIMQNGGIKPKK
jgi:hypothetical protein